MTVHIYKLKEDGERMYTHHVITKVKRIERKGDNIALYVGRWNQPDDVYEFPREGHEIDVLW